MALEVNQSILLTVQLDNSYSNRVVSQQDEKSQHKNKAKALKVLRSRVYEAERKKDQEIKYEEIKLEPGIDLKE